MNTQSKLVIVAVLLALLPHMGFAGIQSSVNQSCNENKLNRGSCAANTTQTITQKADVNVGLNKVGDKVTYNVGLLPLTGTFGNVTTATTRDIYLANPNQMFSSAAKRWTFTPTSEGLGRLVKDKEQQLLFVSYDLSQTLPAWTPNEVRQEIAQYKAAHPNDRYRVSAYVQIAGNEAANQWTELATFYIGDLKHLSLSNIKAAFTIFPDAKVSIQLPPIADENGNLTLRQPITGDLSKLN